MSIQPSRTLPSYKTLNIMLSRKRLESLVDTAIHNACKLRTEPRRLVDIVESTRCGKHCRLGCSNPFFPASSKLLKTPASTSSRNWALSKQSDDRRSVEAKIHALLVEWRANTSFEWRARVASAVPILEEALYRVAESKEDYTNPQFLEAQLKHVLWHFEVGNGPFLVRGERPLYPVRVDCSRTKKTSSSRMAPVCHYASSEGVPLHEESHEIAAAHEVLEMGANLQEHFSPLVVQCDAVESGRMRPSEAHKRGSHTGKKFVKNVISMLSKKRRDEGLECNLTEANYGTNKIEKKTLAAMLELDVVHDLGVEGSLVFISMEQTPTSLAAEDKVVMSSLETHPVEAGQTSLSSEVERDKTNTDLIATEMLQCRATSKPSLKPSSYNSSPSIFAPSSLSSSPAFAMASPGLRHISSSFPYLTPLLLSAPSSSSASLPATTSPGLQRTDLMLLKSQIEATHQATKAETQEPTRVAESEGKTEASGRANSSSSSSLAQSPESDATERGKAARVPLSRFLAEKDEYGGMSKMGREWGDDEETRDEVREERVEGKCCVCMVGLKGAAFIPCGHTFCRRCSRELWRNRGTCPLCNKNISDILDIY